MVCPPHGVGEIVAVDRFRLAGSLETFYRFRIVGCDLQLLVPESKLATAGLRPVIDAAKAREVLALVKRRARTLSGNTWSKRQRVCSAKLATGSLEHAAEVLRELLIIRRGKELSITEKRLLDTARRVVVTELAVALGRSEESVQREIAAVHPAPPPRFYRPDPEE